MQWCMFDPFLVGYNLYAEYSGWLEEHSGQMKSKKDKTIHWVSFVLGTFDTER